MNDQELLASYEAQLASSPQSSSYAYPQMYGGTPKQNLVEWELDFSPELQDIERLLRCDVLVRDKDGNENWVKNPDKDKIFLNDLGVNDVLRQIKLLINKNKVLSNYTIDEIKDRVRLIAHEIRTMIYNNYEAYGIDNEYKMHNYPMAVLSIMSIIEDAYRRALAGETHKGLNEQRLVTQNEQVMPQMNYPMVAQQNKKSSILRPWTW